MKKIVITLLVLVLSVSIPALAGCGGGGNGADADSPEQVVEKFMAATLAEDAETVYGLLSVESQAGVTDKEELVAGSADVIDSYEVGQATKSGDQARVAASIVMAGLEGPLEFEVVLVKEDGAWKINLSETGASMDAAFDKLMEGLDIPD